MSEPIKVGIRADAGAALGTGHFARAAAVADALAAGGDAEILLLTGAEGAALVPAYFPADTRVVALEDAHAGPETTLEALRKSDWRPDVVLLDQYGSVSRWERATARAGVQLVVIDDLDAAEKADVIVRPHGGLKTGQGTHVLRGPAFLPLSAHVTRQVGNRSPHANTRLRLNICFGGSDPTGETAKALQALAALGEFDVDVVIGPGARIEPALAQVVAAMPHVALHRAPSQEKLAELIAAADLALGAGGVMLWERMCLGVPSLVICAATNQRAQIDAMVAAGAVRFLGDHRDVTAQSITLGIAELAADLPARQRLSAIGQQLVDGRGAVRLAAWIRALALSTRDVQAEDAASLLGWRTDPGNWQYNWDGAAKPDFDAHRAWLAAKLADPSCVFRIVSREDEPVGVVRFDLGDDGTSAHLSIYLVPAWHGKRMGLPVYVAAERALRQSHPGVARIFSRIHCDNGASERLHRDAGFMVRPSSERSDWLDAMKVLD